jgi:hypothetical protein
VIFILDIERYYLGIIDILDCRKGISVIIDDNWV